MPSILAHSGRGSESGQDLRPQGAGSCPQSSRPVPLRRVTVRRYNRSMTLHLVKLAVGCDSIDDLADWQASRLRQMQADGEKPELFHRTFQMPKRREGLLSGGSMYWVIKGIIQARQKLLDLRTGQKPDGTPCTLLILDKTLVMVRPVPRRPFQGWRYLSPDDVPADLTSPQAKATRSPRCRRSCDGNWRSWGCCKTLGPDRPPLSSRHLLPGSSVPHTPHPAGRWIPVASTGTIIHDRCPVRRISCRSCRFSFAPAQ